MYRLTGETAHQVSRTLEWSQKAGYSVHPRHANQARGLQSANAGLSTTTRRIGRLVCVYMFSWTKSWRSMDNRRLLAGVVLAVLAVSAVFGESSKWTTWKVQLFRRWSSRTEQCDFSLSIHLGLVGDSLCSSPRVCQSTGATSLSTPRRFSTRRALLPPPLCPFVCAICANDTWNSVVYTW